MSRIHVTQPYSYWDTQTATEWQLWSCDTNTDIQCNHRLSYSEVTRHLDFRNGNCVLCKARKQALHLSFKETSRQTEQLKKDTANTSLFRERVVNLMNRLTVFIRLFPWDSSVGVRVKDKSETNRFSTGHHLWLHSAFLYYWSSNHPSVDNSHLTVRYPLQPPLQSHKWHLWLTNFTVNWLNCTFALTTLFQGKPQAEA